MPGPVQHTHPVELRPPQTLRVHAAPSDPAFSPGEVLSARLLERLADGKLLIRIGNSELTAEAGPALSPGQTVTVKVESLSPKVLLSVVVPESERLLAESLRTFQSNPDRLLQDLSALRNLLWRNGAAVDRLLGEGASTALSKALDRVAIRQDRSDAGFSLRDALRDLGLMTESDMKKALDRIASFRDLPADNLKTQLMRALESLRAQDGAQPGDKAIIRELTAEVEKTVRAIETQQLVNIHFQENEDKWLVQLPLHLPESDGRARLIIRRDGRAGEKKANGQFSVVLALETDALGEIMAQAVFHEHSVTCRIRCATREIAGFVEGFLPELNEQLAAGGYRVAQLEIFADPNIRQTVDACLKDEIYGDAPVLNLFA